MDNQEIYKQIVTDLVTLAIKANKVVVEGNFPGRIADEVNSLLKMCEEVYNEYVDVDDTDENIGGSVDRKCDRCGYIFGRCLCGASNEKV